MASPANVMSGRPRRTVRRPSWQRDSLEEDEEQQQQRLSEEEAEDDPAPRGRRAGKEPVEDDADGEGEYQPDTDDEDGQQQQQQQQRVGRERPSAGSRRERAGDDEAGPSAKRGRRSMPAVKADPDAPVRGGRAAAAGAGAGDSRPTAGELQGVTHKIAEYRRLKEHAAETAEGKASRVALSQAAQAVVRHMLFAHSEKPGVPVKRTEVATVVTARFPNIKSKAPVTAYAIAHAQHYLIESMGLEMAPVAKRSLRTREAALAAGGAEEGAQQYVLRSVVPPGLRTVYVLDPSQSAQRGLLMVVLALIHLAGGKLAEDELYQQLAELGLDHDQPHPVFGRVPEQLKVFCTCRYIQQDKQQGPDGEVILFRMAEQAVGDEAEIGEAAIQRFVADQFAAAAAAAGGAAAGAGNGSGDDE